MNFDDTPQEAEFRSLARKWVDANAPKQFEEELSKSSLGRIRLAKHDMVEVGKAWQKKKAEGGWACLHWPREYGGRGATPIEKVIWQQEEGVYGKLTQPFQIGEGMCGPTVMAFGSEEAKRRYLPKLASGEEIWCQLFSEPAGGSDVAGLRTRAEKKGDNWIVNGQKIWTSGAHYSDYGLLITRTDPNVPKHKGLTMFFLDMKSKGVEVRPIKQANGMQEFNEVYFTDVVIPDHQRLGAVGDGWNVSLTTLMNERMSIGSRLATGLPEMFEFCSNLMTDDGLAIDDPATRSKLASWAVKASGLKYTSYRAISALSKGERPGPENSIGKLVSGMMLQDIATYAMDLQGAAGALTGDAEEEARGQFQQMLLEFALDAYRRRHRRNLAQHHRRARAGPARRHPRRQGRAVQQDPDQGAMTMDAKTPKPRYPTEDRIGVLEELLGERYSVRAFLPQPVPRETIEHVLTAAQRTASWCNSQPWQVLIASGEAKERFRKLIYAEAASGARDDHDFTPPREYLGVYLERRRESGFQLYNTLGIVRGDKMAYAKQALENYNFFGAPHVAIIHTDEPLGIYGAIDCGAYVSNFMLAAQALGLGTIPQAALARHSGLIRRHFKLADNRRVVCGISFGFADNAHKVNSYRTSRASVADTVTFVEE